MLTAEAIDEIEFWLLKVQSMNDKGSTLLNEHAVCDVVVCTDTSAVGYGGYVQEVHGESKHEGDLDQIIDIGYGGFVCTRDGVPLDEHGVDIGVHVDSGDATVVVISPRDGVEAYDAVYDTQGVVRPAGGQGHRDPGEGRSLRGHVITDNTPSVCRLMKGGAKAGPSIGRPLRGQCGSTHSADRYLGGHIIPKTGRPLKGQVSSDVVKNPAEVFSRSQEVRLPTVRDLYHMDKCIALGTWNENESSYSSTWRELEATKKA
ncbi:uncharacterized protein LOC110458983 [Mizuhopecten yessoensis]|uniref:uncharacterized protein LOC110458983 n=1 Tax=Mizuhopecten yessoensis TaxID=6573 RepID=UPI000B45F655|nr:uncharacterized protein LOC110458983 [Mizuhopecten yessoensis]